MRSISKKSQSSKSRTFNFIIARLDFMNCGQMQKNMRFLLLKEMLIQPLKGHSYSSSKKEYFKSLERSIKIRFPKIIPVESKQLKTPKKGGHFMFNY